MTSGASAGTGGTERAVSRATSGRVQAMPATRAEEGKEVGVGAGGAPTQTMLLAEGAEQVSAEIDETTAGTASKKSAPNPTLHLHFAPFCTLATVPLPRVI
jgi:hypothetical protein